MAIDTQKLGEVAARCMDHLDQSEEMDGGRIVSIMVIAIVEGAGGDSAYTRTFSSDKMYYQQMGLLTAAAECVRHGFKFNGPGDEDA